MKVLIENIKIGKRIRKELGNLDALKKSMNKYGLINPIVINSKNELLAGYRRYSAAKELGWVDIEANIMNVNKALDILEIEMEENIARKDFTQTELFEGLKVKKKLLAPNIFIKIWNFIKRIFGFN